MDFWDKVKDGLGKTLTSVESHARDLKDTVDQELKIRKLKSRIEDLKSEIDDLHREVGESILSAFRQAKPVSIDQFSQHLDLQEALEKKIKDVETELNELYAGEASKKAETSDPEIVVEPENEDRGRE